MADQWRATVTEIQGKPVALVEIEIKRTLFIDATIWKQIENTWAATKDGDAETSGMSGFQKFWQVVETLPPEALPYFSMPWSEGDSQRIGLIPLAEIAKITDQNTYFRVEGSPSGGYVGIMNVGGQDRRIDMSLNGMPAFYASLDQTLETAKKRVADKTLTPVEEKLIKDYCEIAKNTGINCEKIMRDAIEAQKISDRVQREHHERDIQTRDFGTLHESHRGDFGPGVGRDMGGHC